MPPDVRPLDDADVARLRPVLALLRTSWDTAAAARGLTAVRLPMLCPAPTQHRARADDDAPGMLLAPALPLPPESWHVWEAVASVWPTLLAERGLGIAVMATPSDAAGGPDPAREALLPHALGQSADEHETRRLASARDSAEPHESDVC